ncbi:putative inner membrane protein [Roseobacter sp. GAI101]|uniref:putative inner membrane protein n=1 Tax=Roseobacter sp. (strain GAI101) TaxID=391589 RepID=UPI0001872286|nr:putative inner membrane protein [Roseobacter sp. GAI101]EEB82408.1 putative inner membrane protein [Roseobacter sp. GAI101]
MSSIAKTHYGHAGRAFVTELVKDHDRLIDRARALREEIVSNLTDIADDPQVRRVAERFALAGAAGILAVELGVLPMQSGSIQEATATCFDAWKAHRGGTKSEEELNALRDLKHFFEAHGAARFERIVQKDPDMDCQKSDDFAVRDRCGYRVQNGDGSWLYYVLPEAWSREVCGDHAPSFMAKIANESGALLPGDGRHLQKKVKLPDYPSQTRVYALHPDLIP